MDTGIRWQGGADQLSQRPVSSGGDTIQPQLTAYRGLPHKALELEVAIYPPEVRLEKAYNLYAIRALRFQKNHPIKQALWAAVRDELVGSNTDSASKGNQNTRYVLPTIQLFRL